MRAPMLHPVEKGQLTTLTAFIPLTTLSPLARGPRVPQSIHSLALCSGLDSPGRDRGAEDSLISRNHVMHKHLPPHSHLDIIQIIHPLPLARLALQLVSLFPMLSLTATSSVKHPTTCHNSPAVVAITSALAPRTSPQRRTRVPAQRTPVQKNLFGSRHRHQHIRKFRICRLWNILLVQRSPRQPVCQYVIGIVLAQFLVVVVPQHRFIQPRYHSTPILHRLGKQWDNRVDRQFTLSPFKGLHHNRIYLLRNRQFVEIRLPQNNQLKILGTKPNLTLSFSGFL